MDNALDQARLRERMEERVLAHDTMDFAQIQAIGAEMERAMRDFMAGKQWLAERGGQF